MGDVQLCIAAAPTLTCHNAWSVPHLLGVQPSSHRHVHGSSSLLHSQHRQLTKIFVDKLRSKAPLPAGADTGVGLLVLSQSEAMLLTTEDADQERVCRVALPLAAEPAACCPLGKGTFCVVDACGTIALLQVRWQDGRASLVAYACHTALHDVKDEPASPEDCSSHPFDTVGGVAAEPLMGGSAPCHVGCAVALPCGHVQELNQFVVLLVMGTIAGPSRVVGLPRRLVEGVRLDDVSTDGASK
jgi:hypothetical protein